MNLDSINNKLTKEINKTKPQLIYNIVMIILYSVFIIFLTKYSFTSDNKSLSVLGIFKENIEKLAGNITTNNKTEVNIIKVWTIYVILALILYLTILNTYRKISHPGGIVKSYKENSVYESFTVAFVFSSSVLLTTAILKKPNYFGALIAFLLIFCKSQLLMDSGKVKFNVFDNIIIYALSIVPLIGYIAKKIYYWKSDSPLFGSFGDNIMQNTFIAVINTIQTNIVLSILLKKYDSSPMTIYAMFIKFNLYGYIFSLMTSETGSIL